VSKSDEREHPGRLTSAEAVRAGAIRRAEAKKAAAAGDGRRLTATRAPADRAIQPEPERR
jgi:hypothetical protein